MLKLGVFDRRNKQLFGQWRREGSHVQCAYQGSAQMSALLLFLIKTWYIGRREGEHQGGRWFGTAGCGKANLYSYQLWKQRERAVLCKTLQQY